MENRVNQQGTSQMSKDFKIGWIIGAIEGEGCITVSKASDTYHCHWKPMIRIDNTKLPFLDRMANYLDDLGIAHYTRHSYPRKQGQKSVHSLFIYGIKRVHHALEILLPYFSSKKELAELVYDVCHSRLAHPMTYQNKDRNWEVEQLELIDKIRVLNHRGDSSTTMSQAHLIRI